MLVTIQMSTIKDNYCLIKMKRRNYKNITTVCYCEDSSKLLVTVY